MKTKCIYQETPVCDGCFRFGRYDESGYPRKLDNAKPRAKG
jgi:hypothetical protein